jgi:hypothetical protein
MDCSLFVNELARNRAWLLKESEKKKARLIKRAKNEAVDNWGDE